MNDYKARAQHDLKIAEAMPRSFWQGRAIRKVINGYEFLIFMDRCGYTGVCMRPEASTQQNDYVMIGKVYQLVRYDHRPAYIMNDLVLNHGWRIPPISVKSGYNDGYILWAGLWISDNPYDESFKFRNFKEFNDYVFVELTELYEGGGFFIGPKSQGVKSSVTELKFYAL